MKNKFFIFIIITVITILVTIIFFSINKIDNTNKNQWNMKITEGFLGGRVFYFYDNDTLVVEDSFHGINKYKWKEDINLNQIYKYIEDYNSQKNGNQEFLVVLKNGTEKYIDQNDDNMKTFFQCFWNYILK
jgi:hypothetical protein